MAQKEKSRRAGGGTRGAGEKTQAEPAREPGLLARFVGVQIGTILFFCALAAAIFAWLIYEKTHSDLAVPAWAIAAEAAPIAIALLVFVLRFALASQIREVQRREETDKDGRQLVKEARAALRERAYRLSETQSQELKRLADELEKALEARDWDAAQSAVATLDQRLDDYLPDSRKSTAREYFESILVAVGIALFLRAFVVEAFKIPSGSMIPTLQVGDHIFVNKFIYGIRVPYTDVKLGMSIRKPERGEVVVFKYPKDKEKDFIKRIVAVEGDTVEIKQNVIYVNGQPVKREHVSGAPCEYEDFDELSQRWEHRRCDAWKETANGHTYTTVYDRGRPPEDWPPVKIPPGTVFVMGDNRNNSHDSRYWGTVPFELLRGKAMIVWWSLGEPEGIRVNRIGHVIE